MHIVAQVATAIAKTSTMRASYAGPVYDADEDAEADDRRHVGDRDRAEALLTASTVAPSSASWRIIAPPSRGRALAVTDRPAGFNPGASMWDAGPASTMVTSATGAASSTSAAANSRTEIRARGWTSGNARQAQGLAENAEGGVHGERDEEAVRAGVRVPNRPR